MQTAVTINPQAVESRDGIFNFKVQRLQIIGSNLISSCSPFNGLLRKSIIVSIVMCSSIKNIDQYGIIQTYFQFDEL